MTQLYEYEIKRLLAEKHVLVPTGHLCLTVPDLLEAADRLQRNDWIVKCQIRAGGRSKAGGVVHCRSKAELIQFTERWMDKRMVTEQTDPMGEPVFQLLLETPIDIERELYFSLLIDRTKGLVRCMTSVYGGETVEMQASENPQQFYTHYLDPFDRASIAQAQQIALQLHLECDSFVRFFFATTSLFFERDLTFLEINPLGITPEGYFYCLDAKATFDSSARFRQPHMAQFEVERQRRQTISSQDAMRFEPNYVSLEGNIACLVNGAGLAMGTLDAITHYGGKPANFLDIGGAATEEAVMLAVKRLLEHPEIKVIFIHLFGGIVCCELVIKGLLNVFTPRAPLIPIVARLQGNGSVQASELLATSGFTVHLLPEFTQAVLMAINLADTNPNGNICR